MPDTRICLSTGDSFHTIVESEPADPGVRRPAGELLLEPRVGVDASMRRRLRLDVLPRVSIPSAYLERNLIDVHVALATLVLSTDDGGAATPFPCSRAFNARVLCSGRSATSIGEGTRDTRCGVRLLEVTECSQGLH